MTIISCIIISVKLQQLHTVMLTVSFCQNILSCLRSPTVSQPTHLPPSLLQKGLKSTNRNRQVKKRQRETGKRKWGWGSLAGHIGWAEPESPGKGPWLLGFPKAGSPSMLWISVGPLSSAWPLRHPCSWGVAAFLSFFFPLHWTISKSYLDSLSWNKKTNNHQTQCKWGKCPQWAAWPELDVKARPEAEES